MKENRTKRIILKKDWDIPPKILLSDGKFTGYFVGRKRELDLLVNEILHKSRGSILVSGHRGVGKTSFVYKALSLALEKDKNILVVLMNAAQLEAESQNKSINPRKIIENLIRRFYTVIRDTKNLKKDIKEAVERLYKKAISEEFKLTEFFLERRRKIEQEEEESTREILLDEKIIHLLIFIISWTLGAILLLFNLLPWEWLNKLLALLLTFPIPYGINLVYKKRLIKKREEENTTKTEELYQFDNKIGNLEFDLEQVHKKVSQNGKKLIYVIDELDKLKKDQVMEALKYFKYLFTLSDALFIFLGGEEIYNIGFDTQQNSELYRQKEYTYFTSRYFLTRPLYSDLTKFIDEITETTEGLTRQDIEVFKRSLCFDAQNDYFDLKRCIRDRITYFENGHPVIEIKEERLSEDYEKAKLHKVLTIVTEDKYMSSEHSKWFENEKLLRVILKHAYTIHNSLAGQQFNDPAGAELQDELVRDFNSVVYRCGAFNIQNENPQNIKGISIPIRTYSYVGHIPIDPPDRLEEPTEYERRYIENFEKWINYMLSVVNSFNEIKQQKKVLKEELLNNPQDILNILISWGYNVTSPFNNYRNMYHNIADKEPPYPYRREDIENATTEVLNYLKQLKTTLPNLIARAITQLYPTLSLQLQNIQLNGNLFSGSANQIRQIFNKYNPIVVFKQNLDRQILLIHDSWNEINQIQNILKDNQHTHRIVCVKENDNVEKKIPGLHLLLIKTPEELERNLVILYQELERFLVGESKK